MANVTHTLPPLPSYQLYQAEPLLPFVSDKTLSLLTVPVSYTILSIFWEWVDNRGFWDAYKIHPTAEVLSRNRVSKWETVRGVAVYHLASLLAAIALMWNDPCETWYGQEGHDIAVWAERIRKSQAAVPFFLSMGGVDSVAWAGKSDSTIAGVMRGGVYPSMTSYVWTPNGSVLQAQFTSWEMNLAKLLYYVAVPACQFFLALFIADTWFYFMHRLFHSNKWLYKTFHAVHHRLYVVYAFGAVYAHPVEGLVIDFVAFTLGIIIAGLSVRQAMLFNFLTVWKSMSDHCGYILPFDPFVYVTANTSKYHDVHHQIWGLKNNFAVFFGIWDRLLGTERLEPPASFKAKAAEKVTVTKATEQKVHAE